MDAKHLRALLERASAGDADAIGEIVRRWGPHIEAFVKRRLSPQGEVGRLYDPEDVALSVLAAFFDKLPAAQGSRWHFATSDDLAKFLTVMARNSLRKKEQAADAAKRGPGRLDRDAGLDAVAARDPSPSQEAAARDLLDRLEGQLSPFERFLVGERLRGRTWPEVAADVGPAATVEALKARYHKVRQVCEAVLFPDGGGAP